MIKWYVSFISGFVLSVPHTVYQLWKFVAPGLKVNEKKIIIPVVLFASLSFGIGIIFGYIVIVPFSLEFFSSIASQDVENNFSIQYYFSFMAWLMIGAGLIFQLPVVSLLLLFNRGINASFYEALQKVFYYCYSRPILLYNPTGSGINVAYGFSINHSL